MPERLTKIVLAEIIPSLNKGEAAILGGIVESFRCLGNTEFTIFSKWPKQDADRYRKYAVKVVRHEENRLLSSNNFLLRRIGDLFTLVSFLSCAAVFGFRVSKLFHCFYDQNWQSLIDSDLVIMGHDNVVVTGFWTRQLATIWFAKMLNKRIAVYGASIGPVENNIIKLLTIYCLNKVDLITVREAISYQYVKKLGISDSKVFLTADIAFLLKPVSREEVTDIFSKEGIENKRPIIGVTVTKFISDHAFINLKDNEMRYQKFIKIIADTLDHLIESLEVTILLIPHSVGPTMKHDDRIMQNDIMKIVNNKHMIRNIDKEYSPEQLKGIIGQCDLLIGSRTHSLIAAAGMNVPMVALTCTTRNKTNGIIGTMLGQDEWLYNVEDINSRMLTNKIKRAWSKKENIRKALLQRNMEIKRKAMLNVELLRTLVSDAETHTENIIKHGTKDGQSY